MLALLVLFLCASSNAYQVPAGIEKLSNDLIRNGTNYYALLVHGEDLLALDKSLDLGNWVYPKVPILTKENGPRWANGDEFQSADINVVDDGKVLVYFSAKAGQQWSLGVAFSDVIVDESREYLTLNSPLLTPYTSFDDFIDPRLVMTSDKLLLTFIGKYTFNGTSMSMMKSARLSYDGLTISSVPVMVVQPDLHWEGNQISNHWGFERNGYIYIVYETEGGVGVARSRSDAPLGLFEKMTEPLIARGKEVPARHVLQEAFRWQTNGWPSVNL